MEIKKETYWQDIFDEIGFEEYMLMLKYDDQLLKSIGNAFLEYNWGSSA